jgi:ABC-2 type transport system permease protein
MAVYDRRYGPYEGRLTPRRTRFLVLPAYSYQEVFASKAFIVFLALWGVWALLVLPILIYLPHNLGALESIGLDPEALKGIFEINASKALGFFMIPSTIVAYLTALVLGPALISSDLRNNGLPLYLSRPFGRWEYVLGKSAVMLIMLSLVTWIPGMLLFLFQCYMGGWTWIKQYWSVGFGVFMTSWIWITLLCVISLAISAYVKWKPVARLSLILIFIVLPSIGQVINLILRTDWGSIIDMRGMVTIVGATLFGLPNNSAIPVPAAWLSILSFSAFCIVLMAKKIRAYEVVKS